MDLAFPTALPGVSWSGGYDLILGLLITIEWGCRAVLEHPFRPRPCGTPGWNYRVLLTPSLVYSIIPEVSILWSCIRQLAWKVCVRKGKKCPEIRVASL